MLREASLGRRLLLGAGGFVALALLFSAFVIGFILHHFVQAQIDQRLDTQVIFLGSLLRADAQGQLTISGATDGPPFDRPGRGWYWQIAGPSNTLRALALEGRELKLPNMLPRPPHPPPPPERDALRPDNPPRPADGPGPDGRPLHFRVQHVTVGGVPATIVVSAPRNAVTGPLWRAMLTLALSLIVLGAALMAAMMLQVKLGLRPLERLRQVIADVRAGHLDRVPDNQPVEVQPLVSEVNALLAENAANLERARGHVANLAHGLKTPLATLALALANHKPARGEASGSELVELIQRRIRHHLGRARMAALSGPSRIRTPIAPRIDDLVNALQKIHADKALSMSMTIPPGLAVACEPQDFDEMTGNLLENAFKWARQCVRVTARSDGQRRILLTVEDDGPGVPPHRLDEIVRRGVRLDEHAPGFGFGLPIAHELAELYGGGLDLTAAETNGLSATLWLPAA